MVKMGYYIPLQMEKKNYLLAEKNAHYSYIQNIYSTIKFYGRSTMGGNGKLFDTSVYVQSKGLDCLELVNPV